MAEKLRVDAELWRLGIRLPGSLHLSLPPPVPAGQLLQSVSPSENRAGPSAHSLVPALSRT